MAYCYQGYPRNEFTFSLLWIDSVAVLKDKTYGGIKGLEVILKMCRCLLPTASGMKKL